LDRIRTGTSSTRGQPRYAQPFLIEEEHLIFYVAWARQNSDRKFPTTALLTFLLTGAFIGIVVGGTMLGDAQKALFRGGRNCLPEREACQDEEFFTSESSIHEQ